jgi:hypothetical protein
MHLTSIIKDNRKAIEEIANPEREKDLPWPDNKEPREITYH